MKDCDQLMAEIGRLYIGPVEIWTHPRGGYLGRLRTWRGEMAVEVPWSPFPTVADVLAYILDAARRMLDNLDS
jgi:hypothetical protein